MRRRGAMGLAMAAALWWSTSGVANATSHCSADFILDPHACEVAHHGPLIAIFGGLTGLIALLGSGVLDGAAGPASRPAPGQRRRDEEGSSPGPNTLNTQDGRVRTDAEVDPGIDLREPGVGVNDLGSDGRTTVQPLDPGLPELAPLEAPRLTQDIVDRWTILGADGAGRIVDRTGQHILTIHDDGSITDLNGNRIQSLEGDGPLVSFTDGQGRQIEYNADGVPMQRVPTEHGSTIFRPVDDLAPSVDIRPTLDPAIAARWTGAGAGLDGELYGADGSIVGRIDTEGVMRTLDGQVITSFDTDGGRLNELGMADGTRIRTPGAPEPRVASEGDADPNRISSQRGDEELAGLVREAEASQARQDAPTRVRDAADAAGPIADQAASEANAADESAPRAAEPPESPRDVDAAREVAPPAAQDAPRTAAQERPPPGAGDPPGRADAPDGPHGPRGAGLLGGVMDLQGAIDQVGREVGEGRSTGEALTRATAMTWAGNAIGDGVNTNIGWGNGWDAGRVTDVRVTLLGSTMLPEGVNNLLPDQMAANTIGTGMDALVALTEDAASSLGGGAIDTSSLDDFTQRLADRPGADPWAGYARLGELLGEEVGDADGDALQAVADLGAEAWTLREDIAVELGESIAEFGEAGAQGRHGSVLQGYAELAQVAGDPPDPVQFGRDLATLVEVAWDDATGHGDSGGFGPGFWQEQADHANQTVRGVPVVGTVFDGYAQVASGIEEQGLGGFAAEMSEGATALGNEAYEYLRSWF